MAVRLKDIARDLNVSVVTVSKVLRGNSDIGEETRKRVLKRMKELNYQPNMLARGLASGKTYTVGLVVPEDPEIERQEIRTLLRRGIDVLLIASCQPNLRNFYELGDERTPYLLFDRNFPHLAAHFVGSNDVMVGEMATNHLVSLGRQRIAHIAGRNTSPSFDRLRGYRNAMAEHRLPVPDEYVIVCDHMEERGDKTGYEAMQKLLALKERPDAVFCYNDMTAIGAIAAVLAAGLRVPEDIAIIGCGNMPYNDYLNVPLSSIDHGTAELGRIAGELALDLTSNPEQAPKNILVPPTLVVRASTGSATEASAK
jgi:LacI family transcriptional regulator